MNGRDASPFSILRDDAEGTSPQIVGLTNTAACFLRPSRPEQAAQHADAAAERADGEVELGLRPAPRPRLRRTFTEDSESTALAISDLAAVRRPLLRLRHQVDVDIHRRAHAAVLSGQAILLSRVS